MRLTSPAVEDGGELPARYTCDGENVSPPLAWSETPEQVAAYVLVVEDPDADGFVHWLLTDIPGDATELPEGQGDAIGAPGHNDFGSSGWAGPCPPSGRHRYVFTLYALAEPLGLEDGADLGVAEVRASAAEQRLAEARLTASYVRRR